MTINFLVFTYGNKTVSLKGLRAIEFHVLEEQKIWENRIDHWKWQCEVKIVPEPPMPRRGIPHIQFRYTNGDLEVIEFKNDDEAIDHYNELCRELKTLHIMPNKSCMRGEEE